MIQLYNTFADFYDPNKTLTSTIIQEIKDQIKIIHTHLKPLLVFSGKLNDAIITFHDQIYDFSRGWITEGRNGSTVDISDAYLSYFTGRYFEVNARKRKNTILPRTLSQFLEIRSTFSPMKIPEYNKPIFTETILFDQYLDLLQYDYFKALLNHHTVRVCHNCKHAFLNTTKHHTIYCDQIAPGESEKTYRQVGSANEQIEFIKNSPAHQLYKRCYKKLNQRYNRGNITLDEFNELITAVSDFKNDVLKGLINLDEFKSFIQNL